MVAKTPKQIREIPRPEPRLLPDVVWRLDSRQWQRVPLNLARECELTWFWKFCDAPSPRCSTSRVYGQLTSRFHAPFPSTSMALQQQRPEQTSWEPARRSADLVISLTKWNRSYRLICVRAFSMSCVWWIMIWWWLTLIFLVFLSKSR